VLVSHSFRMELFFLIAGFFSHMTFHRKGASAFINSRLMRIAIPFVAGWFLLKPLIISGWVMGGESLRGEVHILNGLKAGFQTLGQLPTDLFTGSHLWFLYYLLLITTMALTVRAVVCVKSSIHAQANKWTDRIVAWLAHSRFSWFALALPTSVWLWKMGNWGMDTPDKSLVPHMPVLGVYGGCFGLGWLLHRQPELMGRFARITIGRVALCLVSVGATIVLSSSRTDVGDPHFGLIRAGFVFSYAMMMWSLVTLSIGLFKRLCDKPNKVVRYLADSSYWLYLIHLPIVIWLQIAFAELSFHWSLKLGAVAMLTVGISLVLYDLFIRSTWIGKTLNGRKQERALFRWRAKSWGTPGPSNINTATEGC